jgi:hypothetical protein
MMTPKDDKKKDKKAMPAAVLMMFKKAKPMPSRGGRTATNMANKAKKK